MTPPRFTTRRSEGARRLRGKPCDGAAPIHGVDPRRYLRIVDEGVDPRRTIISHAHYIFADSALLRRAERGVVLEADYALQYYPSHRP